MKQMTSEPIAITPNFYRLGTPAFPAFLSLGKVGMIIEGGTGPTFEMIVEQVKTLGVDMKKIEYILLTHTHADHIGAAATARPLEVPPNFFTFHFPAMLIILYSFRVFIFMNKDGWFKRCQGIWIWGGYAVYLILQYAFNLGAA